MYCEKNGIKRQLSAHRTPQQNGVVERKNRTVQEMSRAMLMNLIWPIPFVKKQ